MTLWLVRAGRTGEFEDKFLDESRIYLTWRRICEDLSAVADRHALKALIDQHFPANKPGRTYNWVSQI